MELIKFIQTKVKLKDEAIREIDLAFKVEVFSKKAILIRPDSSSQKIYFVEKGLVRNFYYKMDKDVTFFFFTEGTFTASLNSIFYNEPEPSGWEALETCIVRSISYKELSILMDKHPNFQKFLFQVAIDTLNLFIHKLESVHFQTAEERYKAMIDRYPDILLKTSLGHIASYLGITQQTLSVIRGRKS